jgi:hypothetical protein
VSAATLSDEIDAERESPAPTLVLMRTQEEPHAAGGPPRADDASRSELWWILGTVLMRFAFKLTLGGKSRAGDIVRETRLRAWRHPRGGRRPRRDSRAVAVDGGPAYRHRPVADQVAAR